MPNTAQFNITVNDDTIGFRPDSVTSTNAQFFENSSDKPITQLMKVNVDRPVGGNTIRRTVRTAVPIVDEVTGDVEWITFRTEMVASKRTSQSDREFVYSTHQAVAADAALRSVFTTPEFFW